MNNTFLRSFGCIAVTAVLLAAWAGGCASKFPPAHSAMDIASAELDMPPRQLLDAAKQVVAAPPRSLGVQREGKGFFLTTYQHFPGEWHVARRWQERTQYRVTVIPDFDEPAKRSRIEVIEQTEQRASDKHEWKPAAEVQRPERARALLAEILKQVRK